MSPIGLPRALLVGALGLVAASCGGPELQPTTRGAGGPLAGCRMEDDGQARTWMCGDLIAQELAADSATEAEAKLVLDKFAADFVEARAVRTDVRWTYGSESFPSVRFEGTTGAGRRFSAQMVVISRPGDARVVQCASNSPTAPCEPVINHLVRGGEPLPAEPTGASGPPAPAVPPSPAVAAASSAPAPSSAPVGPSSAPVPSAASSTPGAAPDAVPPAPQQK